MRMLRWMCGVTKKDQIRNEHVCERISKSDTSDKEGRRGTDDVVRACQQKGRRSSTKKNVTCASTRTEMKTEHQTEVLV